MGILDILKQYAGDEAPSHDDVTGHFDEVAQAASPADLGNGILAAFRSDARRRSASSSAACSATPTRSSRPGCSTSSFRHSALVV